MQGVELHEHQISEERLVRGNANDAQDATEDHGTPGKRDVARMSVEISGSSHVMKQRWTFLAKSRIEKIDMKLTIRNSSSSPATVGSLGRYLQECNNKSPPTL